MSEHSHLIRLQKLRLFGMAEACRELQPEGHRQALSSEALLLRLLDAGNTQSERSTQGRTLPDAP